MVWLCQEVVLRASLSAPPVLRTDRWNSRVRSTQWAKMLSTRQSCKDASLLDKTDTEPEDLLSYFRIKVGTDKSKVPELQVDCAERGGIRFFCVSFSFLLDLYQ